MESFEGTGISVIQAKVSLQATGLVTQLLKIKEQNECLIMDVETIESIKCTIEVVHAPRI